MQKPLPDGYTFRQLTPDDWLIFKTIRLEALETAHGLFGESYHDAVTIPDSEWQERLLSNTKTFYAIFHQEKAVALIALLQNRDNAEEVFISAVYVAPDHRGKGLNNHLFAQALHFARQHRYKSAWCSTRRGNDAIVGICKKLGFKYSHTTDKLWPDNCHADLLYFKKTL